MLLHALWTGQGHAPDLEGDMAGADVQGAVHIAGHPAEVAAGVAAGLIQSHDLEAQPDPRDPGGVMPKKMEIEQLLGLGTGYVSCQSSE